MMTLTAVPVFLFPSVLLSQIFVLGNFRTNSIVSSVVVLYIDNYLGFFS